MNFKQVEAFRTVMMTRSMTATAALMHTSQPNVSRWISLLEKHVGFVLFQRSGTRLIPTREAEIFYASVDRAFIGIDALGEAASAIRKNGAGMLRVAAVGSITQCVLPTAIRLFRAYFPDTPVVVNTGGSDAVAKWQATGNCDIGFCSFVVDLASVGFEKIHTALGVGVVNNQHRMASLDLLTPEDFSQENFISLPAGSINREQIDRHFKSGARMLSIETPYATTICSMVQQGLGVSIVSPIVVDALKLPEVRAIPFSKPVEFHSYVVNAEQFPMGPMAAKMLECVRAVFAGVPG